MSAHHPICYKNEVSAASNANLWNKNGKRKSKSKKTSFKKSEGIQLSDYQSQYLNISTDFFKIKISQLLNPPLYKLTLSNHKIQTKSSETSIDT